MRKILAVVGAALALMACTGGSSHERLSASPQGRGLRPVTIAGESTCPAPAPIVVANGSYYPPNYPVAAVPAARRCFVTVEEARAAGFREAAPPPADRLIAGVYLVPAEPSLRRICRGAAVALRFAVACPGTVPAPANGIEHVSQARGEFLLEEHFGAPLGYVGAGTAGFGAAAESIGHLWIDSTNGRLTAASICGLEPGVARIPTLSPTSVRGRPARFVACPPGSSTHSEHVVLFWQEAGAWHLVSLHGHTDVNRRMDALIARSVRIVRP
jgi:hypothetical protein